MATAIVGMVSRDAGATQTPIEMKFACALKSNGLMRYVSNLNQCKSTEIPVTIHPGPITVCINPDGTVRKIPPYQCQKPGVVLTLPPASGTVYFCAANSNGQLRYVTSPSQCTSKEFPVFVGPNAGTIIVKKVTNPSPDPSDTSFSFTAGGGPGPALSPSSFSLKNGQQQTFSNVTPGSGYSVAETVPSGWDLTSQTCSDGSPVSNINVSPGETVTCTFTDRKRGSIIVKKVTNPSPDPSDTSFSFTAGGGLSPSSFSLKNGQQQTFSDVTPGNGYSAAETVPSGWDLTSSTCDDGSPVTNIDVGAGETVTCTFTDRKRGSIVIKKVTDPSPDPSDTSFSFTAGGGLSPSSFSLKNGQQQTFSDVTPGNGYSASETVPSGWALASSTCDDGSPVSNIDVGAGETVTCTFTDRKAGAIIVKKVTNPNPDSSDTSFSFTAGGGLSPSSFSLKNGQQQTFSDVAPGSGYNLTESVPLGWDLTSSSCDDGSSVTNIDVSAGETVTCTFTDRQRGTIIVKKVTDPSPDQSDTTFSFTAGGGLSPSTFGLKNGQQQTFSNVVPGSGYSAAETVPSGWNLTSSTCDDGSPVSNIDVGAGETVTCTFTNTGNRAPTEIQLSNSSIAENQPSGTDVGTLTTTDPDVGDTHTYTLENTGCGGGPFPDNSSFQIGGVSNDKLQSNASFDFETKNSYTICVRSTDNGGLSFDKQFIISVTNVNEPPTNITLDNTSIDENKPNGSLVGNLGQTGDPDSGETYTFSVVTNGCSGTFSESSNFQTSGSQLLSAVSFNYEAKNSYSICVRVNDPGSPNLSFDKQFTITINDVNDAPVAVADGTYTGVIGNTLAVLGTTGSGPHVVLTGNVLTANDTDEDQTFPHTVSAVAETVTSTGGGTATINSDGSFTFLPGVSDKNQNDTFTYHATDGSLSSAGTVTVHIENFLVWYVDNASAAASHDGRSSSPLLGLAGLNGAGGSGDSDGPGDYIFLYQGSGNYGGGIPLEANQNLWGQPHGLTVNGNNLVAAGGSNPVVTNAGGTGVGLASGVDVQGLNISGTSGDAINGSAVTTATVGTTNAVNISSAGGDGVDLSGAASGDISIASPITGSAGHSVSVAGRSGGTVAFSGSISDTGTGISLSSNGGATINLTGGVTASTGASNAFAATGGGTVNVTGANNTLATTTGTALNVTSTSIGASGLTFKKIDANGAANGIVLNTTGASGGLTVTGTGSAGTGGTIQNVVNRGVSAISTNSLSLSYMNFTNDGTVNGADPTVATSTCGDLITGTTTGCNAAIHMDGVSGVTLDNLSVSGGSQVGINGNNVTNLTLSNSTIQNAGDQTREDGVRIRDLKGTNSITSSTLQGNEDNQLRIGNGNGATGTLTISGSTFQNNTNPNGEYGFQLDTFGTGSFTTTIGTSTFNNTRAGGLVATAQNSSSLNVTASGGTWHGNAGAVSNFDSAIQIVGADSSNVKFNVHDITNAMLGYGLNVIHMSIDVPGTESFQGQVVNNVIGDTSSSLSASSTGSGIGVDQQASSNAKIKISGNTIKGVEFTGITMQMGNLTTGSTTMDAIVQNNNIAVTNAATANAGILITSGTTTTPLDAGTFCADVSGNTAVSVNADGLRVRQRKGTTVRLPGYSGGTGPGDTTAVNAFLLTNNPLLGDTISSTADFNATPSTGGGFIGGAACTSPTLP